MCADLFDRVSKPVMDALKSSQVTWVCTLLHLCRIGVHGAKVPRPNLKWY